MSNNCPSDDDPWLSERQNEKLRRSLLELLNIAASKARFPLPTEFISWLARHDDIDVVLNASLEMQEHPDFTSFLKSLALEWSIAPEISALSQLKSS